MGRLNGNDKPRARPQSPLAIQKPTTPTSAGAVADDWSLAKRRVLEFSAREFVKLNWSNDSGWAGEGRADGREVI